MDDRERMAAHIKSELRLTPEQFEKVRPIVDQMADELVATHDAASKRVTATMQRAHDEIKPLLTAEQQTRLEEMRRRHQHMMHVGPPPP